MLVKIISIICVCLTCLGVSAEEPLKNIEWDLDSLDPIENASSIADFEPKKISSFEEKYGHSPFYIGSAVVLLSAFYVNQYDHGSDAAKTDAVINLLLISAASGYVLYTSLNSDTSLNIIARGDLSTSIVLNHNF